MLTINSDINTNAELERAVTALTRALQFARDQVAKQISIKPKKRTDYRITS